MTSLPATWPATWPAAQQPNQAPFGLHLNISGGTLSDLSPATVLDLVAENHLLILRGLPATLPCEEFEAFGCALGEPILWSDRPAFSVQAQAEPEDFLFETGFMPMHWDGIFSDDHTPDLQIFHCVQAVDPALGGATLFCDTTRVLADAAPHTRALWESLTLHHERFINGRTLTRDLPLVSRHPHRGHAVLRYHEPVPADISILNPAAHHPVPSAGGYDTDQIMADLRAAVYHPRHTYTHHWQAGDIVISDNQTMLHTRQPYPAGTPRLLRRITTRNVEPAT